MYAGNDLHQGRLARPILADQGVNLTGAQLKVGADQRPDAAERFVNVGQLKNWFSLGIVTHRVTPVKGIAALLRHRLAGQSRWKTSSSSTIISSGRAPPSASK